MSKRAHPLTPVASHSRAILASIPIGLFAAAIAALLLFVVVPAHYWNPQLQTALPLNVGALQRLMSVAHSATSPFPVISGDAFHQVIYGGVYVAAGFWYLCEFIQAVFNLTAAADMDVQLPLRIVGAIMAGWAAAVPVYKHVLSRTPMMRGAPWIDGPKTLWFDAAIGAARQHLSALVREFPGGIELAPGLRLPKQAEHESLFAIGLPGSGKTFVIEGVAYQALKNGDHVLSLDVKGGLYKRITALIGAKSAAAIGIAGKCSVWAIGCDIRSSKTAGRIPAIMIPESRDPIWSAASRLVLKGIILKLINQYGHKWGWRDLQKAISKPVEEIARDLQPVMSQVAEMLRSKGDDPTTMSLSVVFNMIAHVSEIVDTCAEMEADGRSRISLVDWARKLTPRRAIVLQHDLSNRENSELLLTVILRVLGSELLGPDIEDNKDHGIWIFADELARFRGAMKEIVELASLGRSRGIRVVATAQSFAQIEDASTRAGSDALTENFGTIIVCKARAGRNANELAETLMGIATYGIEKPGNNGEWDLHKLPALSPHQLSTCLGLTIDWRGAKSIRASIVGLDNVYIAEWPFDNWKRL